MTYIQTFDMVLARSILSAAIRQNVSAVAPVFSEGIARYTF